MPRLFVKSLFRTYLFTHRDHIDYARFKELGFINRSDVVESTCKWLIQQRFIDQEGMRV